MFQRIGCAACAAPSQHPDITAGLYAQSQKSEIGKLLGKRWQRLGLGVTKGAQ
jgi:hypothetical protein